MNYLRLTLATRNTRDFEDCEIQLFNPFESGGFPAEKLPERQADFSR